MIARFFPVWELGHLRRIERIWNVWSISNPTHPSTESSSARSSQRPYWDDATMLLRTAAATSDSSSGSLQRRLGREQRTHAGESVTRNSRIHHIHLQGRSANQSPRCGQPPTHHLLTDSRFIAMAGFHACLRQQRVRASSLSHLLGGLLKLLAVRVANYGRGW
jgi:hypothetical protein